MGWRTSTRGCPMLTRRLYWSRCACTWYCGRAWSGPALCSRRRQTTRAAYSASKLRILQGRIFFVKESITCKGEQKGFSIETVPIIVILASVCPILFCAVQRYVPKSLPWLTLTRKRMNVLRSSWLFDV